MSRLPIRARLTAVFVLVMGTVLLAIGLFLYYRTRHNIDIAINEALSTRQGALRAFTSSVGPDARSAIPPGERFAQILTPQGRVLDAQPRATAPLLTPSESRQASTSLETFERPEHDRYLAGPAQLDGRPVVAVAATSLAERERALEGLGGALLIGGPAALLVAAAIAYAVAARALGTVESMRRQAMTISRADPSSVLPLPAADDEIRRLGVTLNEMLSRIAAAAEHERAFVANASHELRTPIAALNAELELALREELSHAQMKEAIRAGKGDAERLAALASELLELAQADEASGLNRTTVAVDPVLRASVTQLRHAAEREGRSLEARPSGLSVLGDEEALGRAVRNLIDNALVHGRGEVTAGANLEGGAVRVWVCDEGSLEDGLSGEDAFTRFVRGSNATGRPGAGLGLSLVRTLAEGQGGSATLKQLPEGGVRASIVLPAA